LKLDKEIALHETLITRATSHARYGAILEKKPVAYLAILKKLCHLQAAKRKALHWCF